METIFKHVYRLTDAAAATDEERESSLYHQ